MKILSVVLMLSATVGAVGQTKKPDTIKTPDWTTITTGMIMNVFSTPTPELIFEKQPGTDFYKVYKLSVSHDWNCAMTSDLKSNIYSDKGYTVSMAQITCVRKDDEPKPTAPVVAPKPHAPRD